MLAAVASGIIISIFFVFFGKWMKGKLSILTGLLPFTIFCYFFTFLPEISSGSTFREHYPWVKSMGLNLDFYLDGLALLFVLLISGIGTLIFAYTSQYLKGHPYLDRFYGYLTLFMTAMLGMVLSDNVLLLFIFWELTSISSFFLIGFNQNESASRKSALRAFAITGGGGFFLIAGLVLLGNISGTYSIQEMFNSSDFIKDHALYPLIFGFIFIGAITKSAQFPFDFWLPGAMKAPTPVSAYLHSATMVKAGIFLLARMHPVLGNTELWIYSLVIIGGLTMLIGAIRSVFYTDMKSVLAYTTISALGIMVFLLGIGTKESILAVSIFILAHALYKATLFLVTGIIDHKTGTRDLTKLGGLSKQLPLLSGISLLAALSSAGFPLTFGFIGKDLIYDATLKVDNSWNYMLTGVAWIVNVFLLAGGFLVGIKPFFGKRMTVFDSIQKPSPTLWVPAFILASLGVLFGLFPAVIGNTLLLPVASSISTLKFVEPLQLWHGFNLILLLSALTLLAGTLLYYFNKPTHQKEDNLRQLRGISYQLLIEKIWNLSKAIATRYTRFWHNEFLRSYLFKILLFFGFLLAYKLFKMGWQDIDPRILSPVTVYEAVVSIILVVAVILTISTNSRLTAVVSTSVIGFCICLFFVFYSAPDLALTQFSIDTLTVVLFILVLFRLPPFLNFANTKTKIRDGILSIGVGFMMSLIVLHVLHEPMFEEASQFYGDNAYLLAKGKNVVNVILVDFRGMDTMFEIIVLSVAAIGVYSLLKLRLKPSEKE